jgi:hypothetical protein
MAAFAIGEVESEKGANALVGVLKNANSLLKSKQERSKHWARSLRHCRKNRKLASANSAQ